MPTPERARAAGLTLLLGVSGWLLLGGLVFALDEAGLSPPKLNAGVGVAAAGAAVFILGAFAVLCLVALLAALGFAVWREKRSPAAWRNACQAAALGVGLPALLLFGEGPNANVLISVCVPVAALIAASAVPVKSPFVAALAVPALGLVLSVASSLRDGFEQMEDARESNQVGAVEDAAEASDAGAVQAALDALPADGQNLDSLLTRLLRRGDHRTELALILRHPKTRTSDCAIHLRAALEGDVAKFRAGVGTGWPCRVEGAWVAAQHGGVEIIEAAATDLPDVDDRLDVLDGLMRIGDEESLARWLRAAAMATDAGRIRPGVMTRRFVNNASSTDTREKYWSHADVDGMLVAVCANGAYAWDVQQLLQRGAHANVRLPCGATPLVAACAGSSLRTDALEALLDAGADPNLPGTRSCLDGEPAPPRETPLWHLVQRRADYNDLPHDAMVLLVKSGADAKRRSSDGGSLFDAVKDDEKLTRALRGEYPWGETPPE